MTLRTLPDLSGLDAAEATAILTRMVRESGARLVLIDGFQSVEPSTGEPNILRRLLAGLSTQLTFIDAALLVTVTGDARDPESSGFLTAADTLIGLSYQLVGTRHVRTLEVVKQRGRPQLTGRHAYQIDEQGVAVFPRIEVYPRPGSLPQSLERVPFGIPELDSLLGGGPNLGTTTVLVGAPGTGKTTLALHWALHQARPEAPTILLSLREHENQLVVKADAFGLGLGAALASGAVQLLRVDPVEIDADRLGVQLLAALERRPARFVIDDLGPLLRELGPRAHNYLAALASHLHGSGVTALVLLEIPPFIGFRLNLVDTPLASLGESLMMLQQHEANGRLHRVLAVLRMRLSAYDQTLRELVLGPQGARVLRVDETAPGILASAAVGYGVVAPDRPPTNQGG